MKRVLTYIGVFIAVTALIFLFFVKNYPSNIAILSLEGTTSPEQVDMAMKEVLIHDYLNIYNIYSKEENVVVYTGNINIMLRNSNVEALGLTLNDNEVIMGESFMKKHFNYNLLGNNYLSYYGNYNVNCIVKGNDKVYYRDANILENADISSQQIYISLVSSKRQVLDYSNTINSLKSYGINISKGIYYKDVISFFQKMLLILVILMLVIIFFMLLGYIKKTIAKLVEIQKSSKYDLELGEFLVKSSNFTLIFKVAWQVLVEVLIGVAILWLTIIFFNTQFSYSIDYTSLKSITIALNAFIKLLNYYIENGFVDISLAIVKCIAIYATMIFSILIINMTRLTMSIKNPDKK